MSVEVKNAWMGPIAGIARMAALSVQGDAATLAIVRSDLIAAPRRGDRFKAGTDQLEVTGRGDAPRGALTFLCKRIDNG